VYSKKNLFGNRNDLQRCGGEAVTAVTGSMVSAGGLGVAKDDYSGGIAVSGANMVSTSPITGSVAVVGGMGVGMSCFSGGAVVAKGTTRAPARRTARC